MFISYFLLLYSTIIINTFSYLIIIRSIRRRQEKINVPELPAPDGSNSTNKSQISSEQSATKVSRQQISDPKRINSERRLVSFFIKTWIGCILCWLPMSIYAIFRSAGHIDEWKYNDDVKSVVFLIAFCNTIVTPILYLLHINKTIKKAEE